LDQSAEIGALDVIEERAAKGEISATVDRQDSRRQSAQVYGL
jgi:hypothetical protein